MLLHPQPRQHRHGPRTTSRRIDLNALGGADTITCQRPERHRRHRGQRRPRRRRSAARPATAQADTVIVNGTNGDDIVDVFGSGSSVSRRSASRRGSTSPQPKAPTTRSSSTASAATTASPPPRCRPASIKLTLDGGAGNDTDPRQPGRRRRCSAATATTSSSATTATTSPSSAPATTSSSGIRATATTRSKARPAPTPCCSSAPNVAENIDILANGGRALFLRDVANVTMDLDDVETIDFSALGGADNIVVGDLSGTDVTSVAIDLRGAGRRRRRRGRHRHRQRHATATT